MADRDAYIETDRGRHVATLTVDQDAEDDELRELAEDYLRGRGYDKGRRREHRIRLGRREVRL